MPTLFILHTFPPSRRRDCHTNLLLRTNPPKTALSPSLFVGEWTCPSRCIKPLHPHNLLKSTSTALPRTKPAPSQKVSFCHPQKFRRLPEGLPHRTSPSPQPLQKDNNPSPHVCPFIQYVNHSQVCSPAHSSAFETASPQDRCKAPK